MEGCAGLVSEIRARKINTNKNRYLKHFRFREAKTEWFLKTTLVYIEPIGSFWTTM
jgi:hypothetical protein